MSGLESTMQTPAGTTLGRYRLDGLIGRGGMAEVYRAWDTRLERVVAIKRVLPSLAGDTSFLERFLLEARAVAGLEHPNILPVYDYGEANGTPFIVMPCLEGGTLSSRIASAPLRPERTVEWIRQLAAALDFAHASGILHRDIKPGNVLLDGNDRPVLADFGLACMLEATSTMTATGVIIGTPLYLAPELAQGQRASTASDLYAFAALVYEMLSGRTPFEGETPVAVVHQHVTAPVPSIAARAVGLPVALDQPFTRALDKHPARRHTSCREFAEQVAAVLERRMQLTQPIVDEETPTIPVESAPDDAGARRRGRTLGLMAVGLSLVVFVLVGSGIRERRAQRAPGPSTFGTSETATADPASAEDSEAPAVSPTPSQEPGVARPRPKRERESRLGSGSLQELAQQLRRPHALTTADFRALEQRTDESLARQPGSPALSALREFARGGSAYAAGDDAEARAAIDRIRSTLMGSPRKVDAPGWTFVSGRHGADLETWELAVVYGDARGEGMPQVEDHLRLRPDDPKALLCKAALHHISGDHRQALDGAKAVYGRISGGESEAAGRVAQFVADEARDLERWADAVEWYRRSAEHGGRIGAASAMAGGQIAAERLRDRSTAQQMFRTACDAGLRTACRRAVSVARDGQRHR